MTVARCESFDWGFGIVDFGLERTGLRVAGLSIGDLGLWISDLKDLTDRIRVAHCGLRVTRYELRVTR